MRARLQCVRTMASNYEHDFQKQHGAYSDEWDEWYDWVRADRAEFQADVFAIKQFTDDLRSYLEACHLAGSAEQSLEASNEMMQSLATEMLQCEADMIARMDAHINELREFAHCVTELETTDQLAEE